MARWVLGPTRPLSGELDRAAATHAGGELRIAVAWARDLGVYVLSTALAGRIPSIDVLVGLSAGGTTTEGLLRLASMCRTLRVYPTNPFLTFHPKVYLFCGGVGGPDSRTAIVGSSNLTFGGLISNHEASFAIDAVTPADIAVNAALLADIEADMSRLATMPETRTVATTADIQALYDSRLLSTERGLRRRRARAVRGLGTIPLPGPAAAPRAARPAGFVAMEIPFPTTNDDAAPLSADESPTGAPEVTSAPPPVPPTPLSVVAGIPTFYVRTLTPNDLRKLGGATGTLEPDLTLFARDMYPTFWGWPTNYSSVTNRTTPRLEYRSTALVFTSLTPTPVPAELVVWHRAARAGLGPFRTHPAETRLRIERAPLVTSAPPGFDSRGLLVIERIAAGPNPYVIRLIADGEPGHAGYAQFLTNTRPGHRFGYGP